MKSTLLFLLYLSPFLSLAQREQNNWYFGDRAAISFETGQAVAKYDNPQNIYGASASISHPVTGQLLFYSNGVNVWNNQHKTMANGGGISTGQIGDVLIVPVPLKFLQYFVFYTENNIVKYIVVDMNNGGGAVTVNPINIRNNQLAQFAVIRHRYLDAFWFISHDKDNNIFNVTMVDSSGFRPETNLFSIGLTPQLYGDMVPDNAGNKLAVTHYVGNNNNVEVFDFDPVCGILSNPIIVPKQTGWDYAYGVAFSADDSKMYVTYSYQQSFLVQYYGAGFQSNNTIASSPDNFNTLRLAPDNRIYIATHDDGIPGSRIDAIRFPDNLGQACGYVKTLFSTDDGTGRNANFELPSYAKGKQKLLPVKDSLFTVQNVCLGDTSEFKFNTDNPFDSLLWQFGDDVVNTSTKTDPKYIFTIVGRHQIKLTIYRCGRPFVLIDFININPTPQINFSTDTVLCAGSVLTLNAPRSEGYLWSTGEITESIDLHKPALIWLKAFNGVCSNTDTIKVDYYPDIITKLGGHYFICDDDNELVKLDAGGDFIQYKWTPTGDTTQWIIVGKVSDYFVVVKDFRGCNGNGGTKVRRRCPVNVFYPNVFTPNNDGLNDLYLPIGNDVVEFRMEIYNAWGQQIFETDNILKGWDGMSQGKFAPTGTYIYKSSYTGYRNKKLINVDVSGNITLMR
jgi:gliding motility-associated-like protein